MACRIGQVPPKYDGVHITVRVTLELTSSLDPADALETQAVPDLARGYIGLVYKVEDRIDVTQLGCPVQVGLAHEATDTTVTGGVGNNEAGIADVAAAARVVGLNVEGSETLGRPVVVVDNVLAAFDLTQKHDAGKVLEPVVGKFVKGHDIHHGVSVTALDFLVELVMEIVQQGIGHLMARGKGDNGSHRLAIPQSHMARDNGVRDGRVGRVWIGSRSRNAVDSSG